MILSVISVVVHNNRMFNMFLIQFMYQCSLVDLPLRCLYSSQWWVISQVLWTQIHKVVEANAQTVECWKSSNKSNKFSMSEQKGYLASIMTWVGKIQHIIQHLNTLNQANPKSQKHTQKIKASTNSTKTTNPQILSRERKKLKNPDS